MEQKQCMAGDGKVNVEGALNGDKLLAEIRCVGAIFALNVEGGGDFVSDSNGLHGNRRGCL